MENESPICPISAEKPSTTTSNSCSKSYNKAESITSILEATRSILLKKGVNGLYGLTVTQLEKESGRSRGTIYSYFRSIKDLLRSFFKTNNPWLLYKHQFAQLSEQEGHPSGVKLAVPLLQHHLNNYLEDPIAQKISFMELNGFTDDNDILKEIAASREQVAQDLCKIFASSQANSDVDIRVVYALLIGGINYLKLHKDTLASSFCNVDIHCDQFAIQSAIKKVIGLCHENNPLEKP